MTLKISIQGVFIRQFDVLVRIGFVVLFMPNSELESLERLRNMLYIGFWESDCDFKLESDVRNVTNVTDCVEHRTILGIELSG